MALNPGRKLFNYQVLADIFWHSGMVIEWFSKKYHRSLGDAKLDFLLPFFSLGKSFVQDLKSKSDSNR